MVRVTRDEIGSQLYRTFFPQNTSDTFDIQVYQQTIWTSSTDSYDYWVVGISPHEGEWEIVHFTWETAILLVGREAVESLLVD